MANSKRTTYIVEIACAKCDERRTIDGYFSFPNTRLHNKTAREAKQDIATMLRDFFSQKPSCTKCHTTYDVTRDDLVRFRNPNAKVTLTGLRRRR